MDYQTVRAFTDITLPAHTRAVLLDFDDTCYSYEPCHRAAIAAVQQWYEHITAPCPDWEQLYRTAQKTVKERIPTHGASHARVLYFKQFLEDQKRTDTITDAYTMERLYWDEFKKHMQPAAGLMDFLALCRERATKVAVVTDLTTSIQCEKITHLGLASQIDFLVTSEEVGAEKPDPRCFTLALQKVQAEPHNALVIGDSYTRDISGALALGIPAILITHDSTTEAAPIR